MFALRHLEPGLEFSKQDAQPFRREDFIGQGVKDQPVELLPRSVRQSLPHSGVDDDTSGAFINDISQSIKPGTRHFVITSLG
ncbi:MAG: hypothetical protein WCH04_18700, partial [Gammaproteobacteria bacterium]